jgi:serine/threonine-protein kinase
VSLQPGEIVMGRYRITRRLAAGGMGVVYLARVEGAEGFARPAVIKRMLPVLSEDEELVRMFAREARILADLHHPSIVGILDFASERDGHLMALEYVHGYSVAHWAKYLRLRQEPFPVALALWIIVQVLEALHYAHTRTDASGRTLGIVHRDVSPSNVLLDVEGHVKLVDFGVARAISEHTRSQPGEVSVRGKFPYMAPELLSGGGAPGPRTDLYACGVLLHELVRGQNEMRDRDPEQTIARVLMLRLSPLATWREDVDEGLDRVIQRATAKDPAERFPDAAAMADALRALLPEREDRLRTELRTRLRADFLGDLPEHLDVDPLDELEAAWKAPATTPPPSSSPPRGRTSDAPTRAEVVVARSKSGVGLWASIVLAVLAVAGVGVGVWAVSREEPRTPERVVVIERRVTDEPPVAAPVPEPVTPEPVTPEHAGAPDEATSAAPEAPTAPATAGESATPRRPADRAAALTRMFHARQDRLRRCFESHALELEGSPQVSIRFAIDERGTVREAELSPSELASTALGRCLLAVARETTFGPQPAPIAFRIPIQVRTR